MKPGSVGVEDALKGGGAITAVALLVSLVLHLAIVPPVLERIASSSVIPPPPPPKERAEVQLKPPPPPPPKKRGKVAKPKGVAKPKRARNLKPILEPEKAIPRPALTSRTTALPGTFFTSVQKAQPDRPREEAQPQLGVKEAVGLETPKPPPPLPPAPLPSPRPVGPTRDAETSYAPKPQIPRSLLQKVGEKDVKLRFMIAPDGSAEVMLITSSGSPELDQSALCTCRTWRWKPALRDGVPYARVVNQWIDFIVI